jgi:hypothetical protein
MFLMFLVFVATVCLKSLVRQTDSVLKYIVTCITVTKDGIRIDD